MPARMSETFVLRTYPFRESDLIVSFFTRDLGKLRGVARRPPRPPSNSRDRRNSGRNVHHPHREPDPARMDQIHSPGPPPRLSKNNGATHRTPLPDRPATGGLVREREKLGTAYSVPGRVFRRVDRAGCPQFFAH